MRMSSNKKILRSAASGQFTIGFEASKRIGAVEGLKLSKSMIGTFAALQKSEKSPHAKRAALSAKYGKTA
jgi:hypothetical protein